jgi:hypothetical protein
MHALAVESHRAASRKPAFAGLPAKDSAPSKRGPISQLPTSDDVRRLRRRSQGHKKKAIRVREITRTSAPTYSVAEVRTDPSTRTQPAATRGGYLQGGMRQAFAASARPCFCVAVGIAARARCIAPVCGLPDHTSSACMIARPRLSDSVLAGLQRADFARAARGGPQLKEHAPLVRKSWGLLLAHVPWDRLGQKLYDAIFIVAPSLQTMFSKSSVAMGIKMVDMIDSMVNSLDDMETVHKKFEGLGPIHHRNSVHAHEHMPVFETVVVSLLEQVAQPLPFLWLVATCLCCVGSLPVPRSESMARRGFGKLVGPRTRAAYHPGWGK